MEPNHRGTWRASLISETWGTCPRGRSAFGSSGGRVLHGAVSMAVFKIKPSKSILPYVYQIHYKGRLIITSFKEYELNTIPQITLLLYLTLSYLLKMGTSWHIPSSSKQEDVSSTSSTGATSAYSIADQQTTWKIHVLQTECRVARLSPCFTHTQPQRHLWNMRHWKYLNIVYKLG